MGIVVPITAIKDSRIMLHKVYANVEGQKIIMCESCEQILVDKDMYAPDPQAFTAAMKFGDGRITYKPCTAM